MKQFVTLLACSALVVSACTESTLIRSVPAGARVTINDQFVGTTPVTYGLKRWADWPPAFHYRIEANGYVPQEGDLKLRISIGRIIAAPPTLGITLLLKKPFTFRGSYEFDLVPITVAAQPTPTGHARPKRR